MSTTETGIIRRSKGISKGIFVISLVIVAAVSGAAGYLLAGTLRPSQPSFTLNGAGATFPYPLLSAMSANYTARTPNVFINYQSIGSGGGINALISKTVDFSASDAPLTGTQRQNAPNSLHIPETIGSVVLAYNLPGIGKGLNITGPIIADIFLGQMTQWNDPAIQNINPGLTLPNQPITVVHRSDGSGTTFVWTSYLSIVSPTWNSTVGRGTAVQWPTGLGAAGNEGVAGVVRGTQYTVGYVELAYALQNNMSYGYIQNKAGNYVQPSLASTAAALNSATNLPSGDQSWSSVSLLDSSDTAAYPIASFSYLLVYRELNVISGMTQEKAKALVDFLYFVVHDGQNLASTLQYVPLPDSVRTINDTTIASITFDGQVLRS